VIYGAPELSTFYQGWKHHNGLLIEALTGLTDDQVGLRIAPHQWTIWQVAGHVAGVRPYWLGLVGEDTRHLRDRLRVRSTTVPGLSLEDAGWEDDESHPRTADELVEALSLTWQMIEACLIRWTPDDLEVEFERLGGSRSRRFTRRWVIWHLLEHDAHHGGEISLILGANGLTPLAL
jgi:uncharacterized damage-inducible protein DinB